MKANYLVLLAFSLTVLLSCSKGSDNNKNIPSVGTINVINAITDIPSVKVRLSGRPVSYNLATQLVYGAGKLYAVTSGDGSAVVVNSNDTTKVLFNRSFQINPKVYSLYISGSAAAIDTMLREEVNLPFINQSKAPLSADSVVNVRFVNLSANSPALKIKLATETNNEVNNLPYKSIGPWKGYPDKVKETFYNFEIRNATTDVLITTYIFKTNPANRFKNIMLVIKGVYGTSTGSAPFGISEVNYF